MAKPAPCQRCIDVADADYYLTNRLDNPWPFDQMTVALCFRCFIETAMQMAEAYEMAVQQLQAMEQPGALEQVEQDEGAVKVAPVEPKSKPRNRKAPEPITVPAPVSEEGAPSDDQE